MLCWILIVGGLLIMMGQHDRSEGLFYYFRLEDQVPATHLNPDSTYATKGGTPARLSVNRALACYLYLVGIPATPVPDEAQ